jgi:septum formation protein
MRNINIKEIRKYVDYDNPINSCGSYKYESKGYLLFSEVKGNQFTIQGMPIFNLFNFLIKRNIITYE